MTYHVHFCPPSFIFVQGTLSEYWQVLLEPLISLEHSSNTLEASYHWPFKFVLSNEVLKVGWFSLHQEFLCGTVYLDGRCWAFIPSVHIFHLMQMWSVTNPFQIWSAKLFISHECVDCYFLSSFLFSKKKSEWFLPFVTMVLL